MPLRGLRPNRSEKDLKRRSALHPHSLFKRGEQDLPTSHSAVDVSDRAASYDVARSSVYEGDADERRAASAMALDAPPPSPPIQQHTPKTKRFSMMRFRHASDPQISTTAKAQAIQEEVPPVPTVPNAPAIITTAPTMDADQTPRPMPQRRKSRFTPFSKRKSSIEPVGNESLEPQRLSVDRRSAEKKRSSDKMRPTSRQSRRANGVNAEQRMDNHGLESSAPSYLTNGVHNSLAPPEPRGSDSSRSDESGGDHVTFATNTKPQPTHATAALFKFPRRNKNRNSLFPLPVKIPPPDPRDAAPATPRASTSGMSSGSPYHSPSGDNSPVSKLRRANTASGIPNYPPSSPTHKALGGSAVSFAAPDSSQLIRNSSTASHNSARSTPALGGPISLARRGRSATMGSLGGQSDGPPPTPPFATSGRNSTSTAGRSSLSTLFGINHRFRQGSDPHSRQASPNHRVPGTPGADSTDSRAVSKEVLVILEREEGEQPSRYLERLEGYVQRNMIATAVSKTADEFFQSVLRSYMRKFSFFGEPLDMSIRKLLMEAQLPKETQQIDRVIQGFADRYHECNPGIFLTVDKAYFVAFSIIILHTDFFNKSNKRKMQRHEYLRNTGGEGVSEDALACFYDNIVYTPFIHFDDQEVDIRGVNVKRQKKPKLKSALSKNAIADPVKKAAKEPLDPYTLILDNKLDVLRPPIQEVMSIQDPYTYLGTMQHLDIRNLFNSFLKCGVVQVVSSRSRPDAFMSPSTVDNPQEAGVGVVDFPVTKVGIVWRKDTAKRKAARSPWHKWGVILTRARIQFSKNIAWIESLMYQHDQHQKQGHGGAPCTFKPPIEELKVDHSIPLEGAVALLDTTYKRHKNAFVVFAKGGAEETFLADTDTDLNDWLGKINYSAAIESSGAPPRGLFGGHYEGQRQRGLRRLESSHSTKTVTTPTGDVTIQSGKIDQQLAQQLAAARRNQVEQKVEEAEDKLVEAMKRLQGQLKDATHLQILAPIQPKTREQIMHAAGRLAAKIKWVRIEIWRLKCHRDILLQDLHEEKQLAGESKARIDAITRDIKSPPLEPKTSKTSGLARLNSKSSSAPSAQRSPASPTALRPGTMGSGGTTEWGEDIFKTPPEHSRNGSPLNGRSSWQLPPLNFSPERSAHRGSIVSTQSSRPDAPEHRPSVSSVSEQHSERPVSSAASEPMSRYATPTNENDDLDELKSPPTSVSRVNSDQAARHGSVSDTELEPSMVTGSPESKTKMRRSLQRTLRDGASVGSSSHRRGTKGRDSASTIMSNEGPSSDVEVLHRTKGSFTVHGKKASVVTFGSEWQDMPAEERLKMRKQQQSDETKLSIPTSIDDNLEPGHTMTDYFPKAGSVASTGTEGTATDLSVKPKPSTSALSEAAAAEQSVEVRDMAAQRHVSAQTMIPISTEQSTPSDQDLFEEAKETATNGVERHTLSDSNKPKMSEDSAYDETVEFHSPPEQPVQPVHA